MKKILTLVFVVISLAHGFGQARITFGGGGVAVGIDTLYDYANLRAYTGESKLVFLSEANRRGLFQRSIGADDGFLKVVDANLVTWERIVTEGQYVANWKEGFSTLTANNSNVLNQVIAQAKADNVQTVYIDGSGVYNFTAAIEVLERIHLVGGDSIVLNFSGSTPDNLIELAGFASGAYRTGCKIENFRLTATDTCIAAVYFDSPEASECSYLNIHGGAGFNFRNGIVCTFTINSRISNVTINNCDTSCVKITSVPSGLSTTLMILNSYLRSSDYAIYVDSSSTNSLNVFNTIFESTFVGGLYSDVDNTIFLNSVYTENVPTVTGASSIISFGKGSSSAARKGYFSAINCNFAGRNGGYDVNSKAFDIGYCDGFAVSNSKVERVGYGFVTTANSKRVSSDNTIGLGLGGTNMSIFDEGEYTQINSVFTSGSTAQVENILTGKIYMKSTFSGADDWYFQNGYIFGASELMVKRGNSGKNMIAFDANYNLELWGLQGGAIDSTISIGMNQTRPSFAGVSGSFAYLWAEKSGTTSELYARDGAGNIFNLTGLDDNYWKIGGNSPASTLIGGTTTNQAVELRTNGVGVANFGATGISTFTNTTSAASSTAVGIFNTSSASTTAGIYKAVAIGMAGTEVAKFAAITVGAGEYAAGLYGTSAGIPHSQPGLRVMPDKSVRLRTDVATTAATGLVIQHDKPSAGADDDETNVNFNLDNSAGTETTFAQITAIASNATSTAEDGQININVMKAGIQADILTVSGDAIKAFSPFIANNLTATEASALTGINGMIIYVTSTNGTFTSVGFWGYEASAWVKL